MNKLCLTSNSQVILIWDVGSLELLHCNTELHICGMSAATSTYTFELPYLTAIEQVYWLLIQITNDSHSIQFKKKQIYDRSQICSCVTYVFCDRVIDCLYVEVQVQVYSTLVHQFWVGKMTQRCHKIWKRREKLVTHPFSTFSNLFWNLEMCTSVHSGGCIMLTGASSTIVPCVTGLDPQWPLILFCGRFLTITYQYFSLEEFRDTDLRVKRCWSFHEGAQKNHAQTNKKGLVELLSHYPL